MPFSWQRLQLEKGEKLVELGITYRQIWRSAFLVEQTRAEIARLESCIQEVQLLVDRSYALTHAPQSLRKSTARPVTTAPRWAFR